MIFLHYRPIDDIDFCQIVESEKKFTVIIPKITIKELDRHKNTHKNRSVRKRAKRILNILYDVALDKNNTLKNGVNIEIYNKSPGTEIDQNDLNRDWNDDILIGSIIAYKTDFPDSHVRFYSEDSYPRITATKLGIESLSFPEMFKLDNEIDPIEEENKNLKSELQALKDAHPRLTFGFLKDGKVTKNIEISLTNPPDYDEAKTKQILEEQHKKYPKSYLGSDKMEVDVVRASIKAMQAFTSIPLEEYERYNIEVDEYLEEYKQYLRDFYQYEVERNLASLITFQIINEGNKPAEDVDVLLQFPDGCLLYKQLPDPPEEPPPPQEPRSHFASSLGNIYFPSIETHLSDLPWKKTDSFKIEKTNGYNIEDHFQRIKHGHVDTLPKFYVTFKKFETASSFTVDCKITAANIPKALTDQINVKIEK